MPQGLDAPYSGVDQIDQVSGGALFVTGGTSLASAAASRALARFRPSLEGKSRWCFFCQLVGSTSAISSGHGALAGKGRRLPSIIRATWTADHLPPRAAAALPAARALAVNRA
jgi:hypothetical protein